MRWERVKTTRIHTYSHHLFSLCHLAKLIDDRGKLERKKRNREEKHVNVQKGVFQRKREYASVIHKLYRDFSALDKHQLNYFFAFSFPFFSQKKPLFWFDRFTSNLLAFASFIASLCSLPCYFLCYFIFRAFGACNFNASFSAFWKL